MKTNTLLSALLTVSVLLSPATIVIAQTKTPTVTPNKTATLSATTAPTAEQSQIQQFKDKMAEKVDQLINQKKRAYSGIVTSIDGSTIKIQSDDMTYDAVVESSLTKVFKIDGTKETEKKLSDIKKDMYILVAGPLLDTKISPVNYIYIDSQYVVKEGKITEVNKTDFYVKVLTTEKDTYTFDIESATKTEMYNTKTNIIERVGFAKFREGDTIHIVYQKTQSQKDPFRVSADRILIIPQEYFVK